MFHQPQVQNPLIEYLPYAGLISHLYKNLDDREASSLLNYATNLYKNNEAVQAKQIVSCLMTFTKADISSFLNKMIDAEDYSPPYLFKFFNFNIFKKLLELYLHNADTESNLFKSLVWLIENNPNPKKNKLTRIIAQHKRMSISVKNSKKINRNQGFKKSILGNVNIKKTGEFWPTVDNTPLNPVIQLSVKDLPYVPQELEGVKYICIFIHPDDPSALIEDNIGLIIRTYSSEDLVFMEAHPSIIQEGEPLLLEFEKINDYPGDYQYPSIMSYISDGSSDKYYAGHKNNYNWGNDFLSNSDVDMILANDFKIQGWPRWIQEDESTEDSTFILQVNNYGIWEYSDSSTLYIFQNKINKDFFGFIQIF